MQLQTCSDIQPTAFQSVGLDAYRHHPRLSRCRSAYNQLSVKGFHLRLGEHLYRCGVAIADTLEHTLARNADIQAVVGIRTKISIFIHNPHCDKYHIVAVGLQRLAGIEC